MRSRPAKYNFGSNMRIKGFLCFISLMVGRFCGPRGFPVNDNSTRCHCFGCFGGPQCRTVRSCFNEGTYREVVAASGNVYGQCYCTKLFSGSCCEKRLCAPGSKYESGRCVCPLRRSGPQCEVVECGTMGTADHEGGCRCANHFGGVFCEQFLCMNGGKYIGNGTCECSSPRDYGEHCEFTKCSRFGTPPADFSGQCACTFGFEGRHCESVNPFAMILVVFLACCLVIVLWTFCQIFRGLVRSSKRTQSETSNEELRRRRPNALYSHNRRYDSFTNFVSNVWLSISTGSSVRPGQSVYRFRPPHLASPDEPPSYQEAVTSYQNDDHNHVQPFIICPACDYLDHSDMTNNQQSSIAIS